ncbi:uncharacterized protein BDR25DRAFT_1008 [Lindgomyces ingoldianus]|uniref:Uncharacterized protein n=1 Tax=Lindgomyces ingoldianus TaxID=673940 RepID=A0ACB6RFG9_9PLEO|nr:uncharacterized protein BDR25DRAFT_1008 [Lindgomyces ingoldianus]KAF2477460.1 hypothetical protein BDR25DRAFT_1008 [Lindgomyces ingoldianus]
MPLNPPREAIPRGRTSTTRISITRSTNKTTKKKEGRPREQEASKTRVADKRVLRSELSRKTKRRVKGSTSKHTRAGQNQTETEFDRLISRHVPKQRLFEDNSKINIRARTRSKTTPDQKCRDIT